MDDFSYRLEIIYKKFSDWGIQNGFKPSKLALSRFLNVTQGAMQKWEKGTIPSAKVLKTIHDKLGFSYDWLISGEGEIFDTMAEKLASKDAEIKRLQTQRFVEGTASEESGGDCAKAAGQE